MSHREEVMTPEVADVTTKEIAEYRGLLETWGRLSEVSSIRILDALEAARAELSRLRSAPVAVEVPEPTVEEWWNMVLRNAGMRESSDRYTAHERGMRDTIEFLRGRLKPVDPSRILKDGERAVPVNLFNRVRSCLDRLINRDTDSYWRGESRRTLMELHAINTRKEGG